MLKINKKITKKNCYIGKNKPKFIVLHETDNTSKGAGAERHATATYNGNINTTVHYYVDDKSIYQCLEHKDGAYAIGDNNNKVNNSKSGIHNQNSINVEICVNSDNNYNITIKNTQDLVKHLMKELNIPLTNVTTHNKATCKNCPRNLLKYNQWNNFIADLSTNKTQFKNGSYENQKAVVLANVLNVRYERSIQSKVIDKLNKGDVVKLNYCLNNWISIEGYKGSKGLGYVSCDYLKLI